MEYYPKKIAVQCLTIAVLGGFALLLVTLVRPALVVVYPLALTLLKIWSALMVVLLGALLSRLRRSDRTTAMHRKDKKNPGWRAFEERKAQAMAKRQLGHSRTALLRAREQAEQAARVEALERAGVEAKFRPPRNGD